MSGRDLFPELAQFLFPRPGGGNTVAFLQVYLDESGHSTTHSVIVVAGYMATRESWAGFHDDWNAALLDAGVVDDAGSVSCFHMTDFEERRGAFEGWTASRRRALLQALFNVIDSHKLYAVGFAVSVDWWNSIDWASRAPHLVPLKDPYFWAAQEAMSAAVRMTNELAAPDLLAPNHIAFMFAEQREFGATQPKEGRGATPGTGASLLSGMSEFLATDAVATVAFGKAQAFPQLQAADIVAFEFRRRIQRPDLLRWPLRQIVDSRRLSISSQPPMLDATFADLGGKSTYVPHSDHVQKTRKGNETGAKRRV